MSFYFATKPNTNKNNKKGCSKINTMSLQLSKPTTIITSKYLTNTMYIYSPNIHKKFAAIFSKAKRTFLSANLSGSITVEASIVLPIFIFSMISILYLFNIMYIQLTMQIQLENVASMVNASTCITSEANSLTEDKDSELVDLALNTAGTITFNSLFLTEEITTFADNSLIIDGAKGLSFWGSNITNTDEPLDIILSYKVRLPFISADVFTVDISQHCYFKAFNGKALRKNIFLTENYVFVAYNGEVFHSNSSCSYLERFTKMENLNILKNNYPKIRPCTYCVKSTSLTTFPSPGKIPYVYVTSEYDVYHNAMYCSAIEHNVRKMPYSEALKLYPPCSRCVVHTD